MDITPKTVLAFAVVGVIAFFIGRLFEWVKGKSRSKAELAKKFKQSKSTRVGQAAEKIAPLLPNFQYNPGDCRFIGNPVDYVVFNGASVGDITDVVFLEVKSGKAKALSDQEKKLKDAIQRKAVRYAQYNVNASA